MSTQLAKVNPSALAENLANAQQRNAAESGEFQFMKFRKDGVWEFGAEELEVEEDSLWAVHPNSFMEGFIAWGDTEVLGEEMKSMTDGKPPIMLSDLPPVAGRGWQKQLSVVMVCLSGEDEGTMAIYKTSSKGGKKELGRLIGEVIKRLGENSKEYVPVVKLEADSYKHKQYGKIFTPELKIVDWTNLDDVKPAEDAAADELPDELDEEDIVDNADDEAEDAEFEELDEEDEKDEEKPAPKRRRPEHGKSEEPAPARRRRVRS